MKKTPSTPKINKSISNAKKGGLNNSIKSKNNVEVTVIDDSQSGSSQSGSSGGSQTISGGSQTISDFSESQGSQRLTGVQRNTQSPCTSDTPKTQSPAPSSQTSKAGISIVLSVYLIGYDYIRIKHDYIRIGNEYKDKTLFVRIKHDYIRIRRDYTRIKHGYIRIKHDYIWIYMNV